MKFTKGVREYKITICIIMATWLLTCSGEKLHSQSMCGRSLSNPTV